MDLIGKMLPKKITPWRRQSSNTQKVPKLTPKLLSLRHWCEGVGFGGVKGRISRRRRR